MPQAQKLIESIVGGQSDHNINFGDLCRLLRRLGFAERTRGSHHIFTRSDVAEIINLQPRGANAKAYQVRQVRGLILRYKLEVKE